MSEYDCWSVMGITPTLDKRLIKQTYAKLLRTNRPDADSEAFIKLHHAYKRCLAAASEAHVSIDTDVYHQVVYESESETKTNNRDVSVFEAWLHEVGSNPKRLNNTVQLAAMLDDGALNDIQFKASVSYQILENVLNLYEIESNKQRAFLRPLKQESLYLLDDVFDWRDKQLQIQNNYFYYRGLHYFFEHIDERVEATPHISPVYEYNTTTAKKSDHSHTLQLESKFRRFSDKLSKIITQIVIFFVFGSCCLLLHTQFFHNVIEFKYTFFLYLVVSINLYHIVIKENYTLPESIIKLKHMKQERRITYRAMLLYLKLGFDILTLTFGLVFIVLLGYVFLTLVIFPASN